jgi:hypothetical protein
VIAPALATDRESATGQALVIGQTSVCPTVPAVGTARESAIDQELVTDRESATGRALVIGQVSVCPAVPAAVDLPREIWGTS